MRMHKKIVFDTLTSKENRKLFKRFCEHWNDGRLPEYYSGLPNSAIESTAKVTSHSWGFASKLSSRDQSILASAKKSVYSTTESEEGESKKRAAPEEWTAAGQKQKLVDERGRLQVEEIRRTMGLQPGERIQIAPRPEGD